MEIQEQSSNVPSFAYILTVHGQKEKKMGCSSKLFINILKKYRLKSTYNAIFYIINISKGHNLAWDKKSSHKVTSTGHNNTYINTYPSYSNIHYVFIFNLHICTGCLF